MGKYQSFSLNAETKYQLYPFQWWSKELHRDEVRVDVHENRHGAYRKKLPLYDGSENGGTKVGAGCGDEAGQQAHGQGDRKGGLNGIFS